jgi:uncharacterized protein with ParB-like and HNH nuclease domain
MEEPKSLDSLFKEKIFRIPDYQRGYAWKHEQLKDFWEDLVNLPEGRSHYTGVLTLKEIPSQEVTKSDKEFWLIDDHSYKLYHVVDGQQRLTTFVIFLQAFVEYCRALPENRKKTDDQIYISDSLNIESMQSKYLFKTKPTGDHFRTYKFGYTADNPSYEYMRYRILGEKGAGKISETFYTLNLAFAMGYFTKQLEALFGDEGLPGLQTIYKKLTRHFLFNEYVIKDEFDVFVAFETMNNRGKKLSDLELLKNRLIYLTTLYSDQELDEAERKSLRDTVNDAWKEVYYQLGRNKTDPLDDDEFLNAHWMMYFKYSRQTGRDYIRFLLKDQFTVQRIHKKIEHEVELGESETSIPKIDVDEQEEEAEDVLDEVGPISSAELRPSEIRDYVLSLKSSAVHWFNTYNPQLAVNISRKEKDWIERLNRVQMAYFRPLIMTVLKRDETPAARMKLFKSIERFIFIAFRMNSAKSNYRSSDINNSVRALDRGEIGLEDICQKLEHALSYTFNEDGTFRSSEFYNMLFKRFQGGSGYYGWVWLRYFLYEYELSLFDAAVQQKVNWEDLLKSETDKISIEHIYPQTETPDWARLFKGTPKKLRASYSASLGNLLLLSTAINSSLQNDGFAVKKNAKVTSGGQRRRHGYSDGSHSEIEVSQSKSWGPDEIRDRGIKLLKFMESRWGFRFQTDKERERLLFLKAGE